MYHDCVHELAQELLHHLRREQLLVPGQRVGVAVSGGADSIALLRLLLDLRKELGIVLSVIHFNHKLRGAEADSDEQIVTDLARQYKLQLHRASEDVAGYVAQQHLRLEAAGREMRYGYFSSWLERDMDRIATAHTQD